MSNNIWKDITYLTKQIIFKVKNLFSNLVHLHKSKKLTISKLKKNKTYKSTGQKHAIIYRFKRDLQIKNVSFLLNSDFIFVFRVVIYQQKIKLHI